MKEKPVGGMIHIRREKTLCKKIENWEELFLEVAPNKEAIKEFFKRINLDIEQTIKKLKAQFCKHLPRKSNEFCDKCYYCKHINGEVGNKLI